jgi:signal peptidase I
MDHAQPTQPSPTTAQPSTAPAPNPRHHGGTGGVKETIESILVAFILAFIFRAFVVEAFVIPTGSMAPTLMGAHMRFHCPDCGYNFDVNFDHPGDEENIPSFAGPVEVVDGYETISGMRVRRTHLEDRLYNVFCPNCGYQIGHTSPEPSENAKNPPVFYGDRILVMKYLYLFQQPSRWDVVVFKSPVSPAKYDYQQNYIKRLIGKPGEAVMVLDGDVYIRSPDAKSPTDFVVQAKPKPAQDALWRLVYDNDYRPQQGLDRGNVRPFRLPWSVIDGKGWDLDSVDRGRAFAFDNIDAASSLSFDTAANPTAQTTSDYLVYDSQGFNRRWEMPVSDLDLRLTYERSAGDGPLKLTLTKREHAFTAVITANQATLVHDVGSTRVTIGQPYAFSPTSRPMRVELSNADYQVTLRIDGNIVAQTTPADFAPDMSALLAEYRHRARPPTPSVMIAADRQRSRISHVSLWRDVYYENSSPPMQSAPPYAVPADFPDNAQVLAADEYFVMGDNSLVSWDARFWTEPIDLPGENLKVDAGRVPGRFMLGKAFFVYWPAGYRPFTGMAAAFVPNFGDMRMIH